MRISKESNVEEMILRQTEKIDLYSKDAVLMLIGQKNLQRNLRSLSNIYLHNSLFFVVLKLLKIQQIKH